MLGEKAILLQVWGTFTFRKASIQKRVNVMKNLSKSKKESEISLGSPHLLTIYQIYIVC